MDFKRFGLRVPVKIIAPDGAMTEGDGLIDTGATCTAVDVDLPPDGTVDRYHCGCGSFGTIYRVSGRLEAQGHHTETLWTGIPGMQLLGVIAILGMDFVSACRLAYDGATDELKLEVT